MKRSFRVLLTPLTYVHVGQAHRFGVDIDAPRISTHPMRNRMHGVIEKLLNDICSGKCEKSRETRFQAGFVFYDFSLVELIFPTP